MPCLRSPARQTSGPRTFTPQELINPPELHFERPLGSGGFGTVYRGYYRGQVRQGAACRYAVASLVGCS